MNPHPPPQPAPDAARDAPAPAAPAAPGAPPPAPGVPTPEQVFRQRRWRTLGWRALALGFAALGLIGLALPVMPTVPFMLAAAWAAGRGWPAFENWLLEHAQFGPPIRRWRERGAIGRRAKWTATLMMASSAVGMQFFTTALPLWLRVAVPVVMAAVALWMWSRPDE